jgi:hypothetical protein
MKALSSNVKRTHLIGNGLALGVSLWPPLGLTLRRDRHKGTQGNDHLVERQLAAMDCRQLGAGLHTSIAGRGHGP